MQVKTTIQWLTAGMKEREAASSLEKVGQLPYPDRTGIERVFVDVYCGLGDRILESMVMSPVVGSKIDSWWQ